MSAAGQHVGAPEPPSRFLALPLNASASAVLALSVIVLAACTKRELGAPVPDAGRATPARSAPLRMSASSAPRSVPSAPPEKATLHEAPVVDSRRAVQAIQGYRQFLQELCRPPRDPQKFADAQFAADADREILCLPSAHPRSLASGSFLEVGADEVLLSVSSGLSAAAGEATLAVMRRAESGYRLVRHLTSGGTYAARLRVVVPEHVDVLVLCESDGRQGAYQGTCGFFGSGRFGPVPSTLNDHNEVGTASGTICGNGVSINLERAALEPPTVRMTFAVEAYTLEANGTEDRPPSYCSKKTTRKLERFTLDYVLGPEGHFRRQTPIPPRITQALTR